MKRLICICLLLALLPGCNNGTDLMDGALALRSRMLTAGCSFEAEIVADYGDVTYTFTLACVGDKEGNLSFTVVSPESISGITGRVGKDGGKLTFNDVALSFPLLAEELVTPVSGPWVFYTTVRSGYIASAGADGEYTRVTIQDNVQDQSLQLDLWMTEQNIPVQADIRWENRRILIMQIRNFVIG